MVCQNYKLVGLNKKTIKKSHISGKIINNLPYYPCQLIEFEL